MKKHILLILLALAGITVQAQIPTGYYNSANGLTGTPLKTALHNIIKGHTVVSYAGLLDAFAYTDCDANQKIIDIYSNYHWEVDDNCTDNYHKEGDCWNREHTWPQSWFNEKAGPKSDLFHVYPTDGYVNNRRSNYPYGEVSNPSYTSGNGSKLGPCTVSGYSGTVFEPIDEYKGDIARSFFYMSVRYYGEDSGWSSSDMTNKSEIRPWAMAMLLNWSDNDPVSAKEMARNNAVYGYQGNRNPFIDNPEYAHMIWDPNWSGASYAITCATGLSNGSISAPASATKGTIVSITATPNAGYEVDTYSAHKTGEASTIVTVSSNGTFTMPNYPVTVSATFKQNTTSYPITLGSVTHGSISATTTTALSGATVNLSATPAAGYTLYSWYVFKTGDMNIMIHTGTGNSFTMPAFPVTVLASFTSNSNGNFVRLTSTPSDWSGNYILVYEQSNTGYVWTGADETNCFVSKTITNNTIADDNLVNLTIATMTGGHSIKVNGGTNNGKYIHGTSGENELKFNTTAQANTLTFEDNSVKMVSNTSVMRFNTASNQQRFRYFKSDTYTNQQPIQLYKRIVSIPTHSINFYPNGGSGTMGSQSVPEMTPTPLNANAFTREGYLFDGWTTNADGTGTYYIDGASVMTINDINLYAQWIPLYTVTCATGLSHGSIQASPTSAVEGTTITLTATPDTDYEIDAWTVTDENGHSIEVVENQFEMPASNVTVSAGFFPQEAFTAHYYLVTSTNQLVVGRKYLIVNTQYGKALGTTQNDNNRAAVDVSITSNGVIQNIGTTVCQLTLGFENNHWTFFDPSNNGYLYAASSGSNYLRTQTNNDANGQWTISIDANGLATIVAQGENTRNNLRYNRNSPLFSCYASTQGLNDLPLTSLYVRSETCDFTESGSVCLNAFDKNIIHSGVTLTASSVCGINQYTDPSLLIIEEGAQLIHQAGGLKATLKKTIQAYTEGESDGWYTIAVPFSADFNPNQIATADYDLYYYDEDALAEWINYKAHPEAFPQPLSSGYLYAHKPSTTLRMTGTLNSGNYSPTVNLSYGNNNESIKGYNLLGNPTAHEISFTKSANVSDGYYYLNNNETWTYKQGNTVPVGRGFLVKANAANQSVTLNSQGKDNRDDLGRFLVINIDGDLAYVKLTDGVSMPLLSFKGRHSKVWLNREGKPYIMLVRDQAEAIDLCYQPNYEHHTLSVEAKGLDLGYLHLIDHLTGADIDLLQNPNYRFESSSSDYEARFQLVFGPNAAEANDNFAFIDANGNLIVNGDGLLQVIDVLGHQLFSRQLSVLHSQFSVSPGVYVLRLTTPEKVRIQKIVIN